MQMFYLGNIVFAVQGVLKHDPQADLTRQAGSEPGPLDEVKMWENHLGRLHSIEEQLNTSVAKDILHNLEQADSQYAHSFRAVRKDINKVGPCKKIDVLLCALMQFFVFHVYCQTSEIFFPCVYQAATETRKILRFLETMRPWFQRLHDATDPKEMLKLFKPLMTVLNLVWMQSV